MLITYILFQAILSSEGVMQSYILSNEASQQLLQHLPHELLRFESGYSWADFHKQLNDAKKKFYIVQIWVQDSSKWPQLQQIVLDPDQECSEPEPVTPAKQFQGFLGKRRKVFSVFLFNLFMLIEFCF